MSLARLCALAVALVAARPAAAGDLWSGAAVTEEQDRARREYDRAMLDGDDAVANAVTADIPSVRERLVSRAVVSYELAARARPDAPEPHFRAASVIRAFYEDCKDLGARVCERPLTPALTARMIEHWDAFERLAPGDPRLVEEVLFERALTRTRRASEADLEANLEAAGADYRKLLDLRPDDDLSRTLGNLAETYMMLGDLDRAIETYRRSVALNADLSQEYGLAVALDRDEQGAAARALIAARGEAGLKRFRLELGAGAIFFVPDGEVYYYLALAAESLGDESLAIQAWDAFLASGAHPQYAARARHNRDALLRTSPDRRPPPRTVAPRRAGGLPPLPPSPPSPWTP